MKALPKIAIFILILMLLPTFALAEEDYAPLNNECTLQLEGFCNHPKRLTDFDCNTGANLKNGSEGTILWTGELNAGIVYWEWTLPPRECRFDFLAEDGSVLQSNVRYNEGMRGYLTVPESCFGVRLTCMDEARLTEWHIYRQNELPQGVLLWDVAPEKCDLMLVVAHSDDELVMMGGIVPTYAGDRGYNVQVVYCYVPELYRHAEALAGLRYSGMTTLPTIFITEDEKNLRFDEKITEQIRRFRPEVIITHDINGEYGNVGHVLVSRKTREAVEAAADETLFPASAEQWGTWQVKKFYIHLYEQNSIRMDFDTPLSSFGGKTAFELAQEAYGFHKSQRSDWLVQLQSNRWDCREYGLYFSTVGMDVAKDDFFENIPKTLLSNYREPTPEPTLAPTVTPTIAPPSISAVPIAVITLEPTVEPTAEPTIAPAPSVESAPLQADSALPIFPILLIAAAAAIAIIIVLIILLARRRKG